LKGDKGAVDWFKINTEKTEIEETKANLRPIPFFETYELRYAISKERKSCLCLW
jgi:hypothetical protein